MNTSSLPLYASHLTKRFGDFVAVNDVTLEAHPGEIVALLGPNGAGKTTTIRMVMGILFPDRGEIRLFGEPPHAARLLVGYLPESRGLYRNARVGELLIYLGVLKGLSAAEASRRADLWLERFGLSDWKKRKIHELSHGMQQKVQLAAALLHDPPLVILDEPFQGLDPVNIQLVRTLIRDLRAEGRAVLLSSHQLHHVEPLADRVALIDHGQIVETGSVDELKRRYAQGDIAVRLADDAPLPADLPGIAHLRRVEGEWRIKPAPGVAPQEVLAALLARGLTVEAFAVVLPSLEEVFLRAVAAAQNPQKGESGDELA